ncbi:hypothetical protein AB0O01_03705 [Streptomyces sp. NPDC093252]|uniref:hypothetical protein n=1 Tax=Streptomyces sp. NPDC093252 TaxID=3154980 RepID=UPI003423F9AA
MAVGFGVCLGLLLPVVLSGCSGGGEEGSGGSSPSVVEGGGTPSGTPDLASPSVPEPVLESPEGDPAEATEPPVEEEAVPDGPEGAEALWGAEYSGTAEVSVDVYDYCAADGSRQLADSQSYSMSATLSLGAPRSGGGATEDNPFTLVMAVGQPDDAGAVSLWSSAVSAVSGQDLAGNPRDPDLLLTYWDMEWDDGEVTGRLIDDHTDQAVALNLLNWPAQTVPCRDDLGQLPLGFPHALGEGTTLGGDLDTDSASLTVQGGTGDGQFEFGLEFGGSAS